MKTPIMSYFALLISIVALNVCADSIKVIRDLPETLYKCSNPEWREGCYQPNFVHFDKMTEPMVLIVPECVTNMDWAAITGPYLTKSGGVTCYNTISTIGITHVFFEGNCPHVWKYYDSTKPYQSYAVTGYPYGGTVYFRDQFYDCTVYYEEGTEGWTNGMSYCSGTVKPGAVRVAISPYIENKEILYTGHQIITMTCMNPDATIYYTLDGTDPTLNSLIYTSPIEIEGDVIVKAIATVPSYPFAVVSSQTFVWQTVSTPVITPEAVVFRNTSQNVQISCATEDAEIWYTLDGSDPIKNGQKYGGPFQVYKSSVVRAISKKDGWHTSSEATSVLTRAEGLSEAANLYGYLMETDGSYPWTVVMDVSHDGVSCVRSGAIGNGGTTHLTASVRKAGAVSFWWKAACEDADVEDGETYYYDYGVFLVDDVEKAWIAGHDTGWRKVVVEVPSGGKHVLRWEYRKDGATSYAPDCVWLDQVQWIPADGGGYTLTTPEPVPYAWLSGYGLGLDSDFETAAKCANGKRGGDGRALQVWQDYVAGTDPTNVASVFRAGIELVDDVPYITWSPNLNSNGIERIYTIWGKTNLTDGADWECPTNAAHRFFKVSVEMP